MTDHAKSNGRNLLFQIQMDDPEAAAFESQYSKSAVAGKLWHTGAPTKGQMLFVHFETN